MVKGEAVGVQVLVHNYMDRDINADITLDNSGYQFTFTQDENEIESRKLNSMNDNTNFEYYVVNAFHPFTIF